jgi:hypothetical protein
MLIPSFSKVLKTKLHGRSVSQVSRPGVVRVSTYLLTPLQIRGAYLFYQKELARDRNSEHGLLDILADS